MAKLSIIVPIYKVEDSIERCARSLFQQVLRDIEFIFINDSTPDNSMNILYDVIKENKKKINEMGWSIIIEEMPQNCGLPSVRKHGIHLASGEYIAHCDSDDWVDSAMYCAMYETAIKKKADVVVCDFKASDGEKSIWAVEGCRSATVEDFLYRLLFQKDQWALWNKIFRREIYDGNVIFPTENMGEDMVVCIQLIIRCRTLAFIPTPYYTYYLNGASITTHNSTDSLLKRFNGLKKNVDILSKILKDEKIRHKYWIINGLQYRVVRILEEKMYFDRHVRDLWFHTYPGTNVLYILNPYMTIKSRVKCLLALLGLYPFDNSCMKYLKFSL